MGLLNFLSRKNLGDRIQQDGPLITQAYHSTTAASAPVRGTFPVGGNGKTDLETLTKARGLNHSQSLGLLVYASAAPAPAPAVPLSRFDNAERPSTAPNGNGNLSFAPNRLKKGPAVESTPLRQLRRQSLIAGSRPGSSALSTTASSIQPIQERSVSLSDASGSVYKDIVDAQSELKPLDFKSRIKATGARDYGEDVADRNIRENGCDLDSPAVQSYYAQDLYEDALRKPGSLTNISRPFRRDVQAGSRLGPFDSSSRTGSFTSSTSLGPSKRRPYRLSHAPNRAHDLEQRPRSSGVLARRQSHGRQHSRTGHARQSSIRSHTSSHYSRGSLPGSPLRLATHFPELLRDDEVPSSPEGEYVFPRRRPQPAEMSSSSTIRPLKTIPSVNLDAIATDEAKDQDDNEPAPGQRSFPLVATTKTRPKTPTGRQLPTESAPQTPQSIAASSISSSGYHTANEVSSEHGRNDSVADSLTVIYGPVGDLTTCTNEPCDDDDPAPSPCVKINQAPEDHYPALNRTHSLTSSLPKLQTTDLPSVSDPTTTPAIRAYSLRNWSITSTTPTNSDSSSSSVNPYNRPISRHTAQTSVDLGPPSFTKTTNTSQNSLAIAPPLLPPALPVQQSRPSSPLNTTTSPSIPPLPTFNIDDYISSDSDSLSPSRPRAADEESLLFSPVGYGGEFMLPGLNDSLAKTPPPQPHALSTEMDGYLGLGSRQKNGDRRYVLDTAADSEEEEDDGQYTLSGGLSPARSVRETRRFSAISQEPMSVKLDSSAALRMRKEAKARRRAMGVNGIRRRPSRKGKEVALGYEDGEQADVEC